MTSLADIINSLQNQLSTLSENDESVSLIEQLIAESRLHHQATWASHMTPTIDEPALLGQLIAGLHNGNLLSPELYPQLVGIERQLLGWFCALLGLPFAHFTHGSSYGNLDALWQAREHAQRSSNIVYGSEAAHYSISKACRILGLNFQSIPTDESGKLEVAALRNACQLTRPLAIVATAGTSSCGAIDPISSCSDIAKEFNSWLHIDAAWGGGLMLSPTHQHHLKGISQADSVCFDPHKALGQPKPCSVLLYQKPLTNHADSKVDYLSNTPRQTIGGSYGGELFLPLWCSLLFSGQHTLSDRIDQRLKQAEQFYLALIERTDWKLLNGGTGIICFRPSAEIDLTHLIKRGQVSTAKINDQKVYRVVFASHTSEANAILTGLEPFF